MVENIWNTAKAFIGLSDEAGVDDYSKKEEKTNLDLGPIKVRSSKMSSNSDYEIMLYEPRAMALTAGCEASRSGGCATIFTSRRRKASAMRVRPTSRICRIEMVPMLQRLSGLAGSSGGGGGDSDIMWVRMANHLRQRRKSTT